MRILYVEDNPDDATLVSRYIATTGHDLVIVSNIADAWLVLNEPVDLIMVDILLANKRAGYTFARELRAQSFIQPLVAITALGVAQEITAGWEAGFNEILTKPFQITELAMIIKRYEQ